MKDASNGDRYLLSLLQDIVVRSVLTPRAGECKRAYREVVVVADYENGGEVEVQAARLHSKHRFTHVR
jgi:hypothetical protein